MEPSPLRQVARNLARPVTAPLDGRVGDINRRIAQVGEAIADLGDRLEEVENKIGANVTTIAEANIYVGQELRRLCERLDQLESTLARIEGALRHEEGDAAR